MRDYKELLVWQKSINLVSNIYKLCEILPQNEQYALSSQIKRSAVSIPSNIAEGSGRNSTKEFIQFLYISLGSACELETQLIIANNLGFINLSSKYIDAINEIRKMLNGLIKSLKSKTKC